MSSIHDKFAATCVPILAAIALALTLGIPYAVTKRSLPLDDTAWTTEDGRTRIAVAAGAMLLAAVAVAIAAAATALALMPKMARRLPWGSWSLASTAYALGFGCYPVWLNGAMTASSPELFNDLDPKRVAPFVWFGQWFDYPDQLLTLGIIAVAVFTPFIGVRVIIELVQRRWSWRLLTEAALPLAWIFLHQTMLFAFTWSLD